MSERHRTQYAPVFSQVRVGRSVTWIGTAVQMLWTSLVPVGGYIRDGQIPLSLFAVLPILLGRKIGTQNGPVNLAGGRRRVYCVDVHKKCGSRVALSTAWATLVSSSSGDNMYALTLLHDAPSDVTIAATAPDGCVVAVLEREELQECLGDAETILNRLESRQQFT